MRTRAHLSVIRGGTARRRHGGFIEVEHPVQPIRFEHIEPDHAGPGIVYALFLATLFTAACAWALTVVL